MLSRVSSGICRIGSPGLIISALLLHSCCMRFAVVLQMECSVTANMFAVILQLLCSVTATVLQWHCTSVAVVLQWVIGVFFAVLPFSLHTFGLFMQKLPIFITLLEYQDVRKLVIKYRAKFLIQTTTKIYFLPLFIDNFRKEFTRIILIS